MDKLMKRILAQLTDRLGAPVRVEDVNTNNAWGFGGWSGKRYVFTNGFAFEHCQASTRHCGLFPISRVKNPGCIWSITPPTFVKHWDNGLRSSDDFLRLYWRGKFGEEAPAHFFRPEVAQPV